MARKAKVPLAVEKLDVKRRPLMLDIRCGDCMFFKRAGVYKDSANVDRSCEGFGTVSGSDPCRWFTADPKYFAGKLGEVLKLLDGVERPQVLAAALMSARKVKRLNLSLGQKIYFHVMGDYYLCNYASGLVVGTVKDVIVIESDGYIARIKRENVLTEDDWKDQLAKLLKANRINDPNGGLRRIRISNVSKLMLYKPEAVTKVPIANKYKTTTIVKANGTKQKVRTVTLTGSR